VQLRTLAALAAGLAMLAIGAAAAPAATPATPYDTIRLNPFESQLNGRFADRMKSAGDLDRDGVGDVWIAAYSHDVAGLTDVGRIWAMSGRTLTPLYVIDHPQPQACTGFACGLGWNLSNLGDVDGDGIDDLVAAANRQNVTAAGASCTPSPANTGCNPSQGKAFVFSGAPNRPKTPLYELNNPDPQANGYFGWGSTAGDLVRADNTPGKDGISEVLVGAFQNDFPAGCGEQTPIPVGCRKDEGRAYIFNGNPNLAPGTPRLVRALPTPADDRYVDPATGSCVSANAQVTAQNCGGAGIVNEGIGDVDRDGFWDQSVTAWTTGINPATGEACRGVTPEVATDACNERQGRIYVYSGRTGDLMRKLDNPVPQQGALFGLQIVQAGAPGDVNADGFDDVYAIGFQQAGPSRNGLPPLASEGRAWVFSGAAVSAGSPATPFSTPLLSMLDPTPEANGTFGYSLERTDFNRDGIPDLYMGSFAGSYVFSNTGELQKIFDLPAADAAEQPPGNTNLGRAVAAPGDLNGDGEPDYVSGSPGHDVGAVNTGRAYVYLSNVPPAPPPAPPVAPGPRAPGGPPASPGGPLAELLTSKLALARATINRRERMLDVLAPITSRASGRVRVQLHAAGRRHRFDAAVDSRDARVRFRQPIPAAQARLGTGILTIAYPGDADTRPQTVRLRAANRRADLRLSRPTLSGDGRLRAAGTISRRARGVVRVQIEYVSGGQTTTLQFTARIRNGRWSLDERLAQTTRDAIARRTGTVHSYTLFTGYHPARMRGEMRSYQILGAR